MEQQLQRIQELLSYTCCVSFPTLIFVPVCGYTAQSHVLQVPCASTTVQTAKLRSHTGNTVLVSNTLQQQ